MSANFTGVTFAKQKVTPSYDGIIRRALLTDGTLTGCEMSYSGSTLTMSAGQLLLCGRQIVHPSSQNWAVTEQTSGFARLVLTIDLTRTSTKETFDQVVDSIQYATSVDGFAALEQTDINTTGTKYQVAACVVSLGTGGITGIVSKLEKCEGGGAGLNFKVVGGTTRPVSPTENTIWVNTDVAIPSWAFSATEPGSPVAGMVWFPVGTSSSVAFNALKKNDVHVYPNGAKQYIGSEWVSKDAETFQGGQWVDWTLYLYNNGDQCLSVSGGFDAKNVDIASYNGKKPTIKYGTSTMTIELPQTDSDPGAVGGIVYAKNKFDLTGRSAITFKGSSSGQYGSDTTLCVFSSLAGGAAVASVTVRNVDTATLDVSSVTGEMYVGFSIRTSSRSKKSTITVSELLVS